MMAFIQQIRASYVVVILAFAWVSIKVLKSLFARRNIYPAALQGPQGEGFIFGVSRTLGDAADASLIHQGWAAKYGPAYRIPTALGSWKIVICDPKAAAHFYSKETYGYVQTKLSRAFIENLFGRGLLWAEGDSHKRQRKALSPAFSNAAIRRLTSVFYDSSYKMKAAWEGIIDADSNPNGTTIDVQKWMNHISLDSIGIAGFGHDFHSLDGETSSVVEVFEAFGKADSGLISHFVGILAPVLPMLLKLPTRQNRLVARLNKKMVEIADVLLERSRREKEGKGMDEDKAGDKSIIGLLIKSESSGTSLQMSQEEVMAQNVLLLAGYETTSISLTWSLIELSRKPEKQQKLREELAQFTTDDPTYEQLTSNLPYLDSVVQETLRLHPPVGETTRVAAEDDVMPFSTPVTAIGPSGDLTTLSSLYIPKGTIVTSPIRLMNQSEAFWGPHAKEFNPERWLPSADGKEEDGLPAAAKEIGGYRHLLTFSDGPRICLGRALALTEFKAALSVLIRNYTFELPQGPKTVIEKHRSILPRPKVQGEDGARVPLIVRRTE